MSLFDIILLGFIQGITEFLPISSSGHLVVLQKILKINQPELLFNISLHVGTLLAIIIALRREVKLILTNLINLSTLIKKYGCLKELFLKNDEIHLLVLLIIGSLPTAIIGLFFQKFETILFGSLYLVGSMLLISGSMILLTVIKQPDKKKIAQMKIKDSLIIGAIQGIAIIPGLSRSGMTISMGLFLGIEKKTITRYSFLLSIPAIIGALILTLWSSDFQVSITLFSILLGVIISSVVGFIALKLVLFIISSNKLCFFAPYCYILGLIILKIS